MSGDDVSRSQGRTDLKVLEKQCQRVTGSTSIQVRGARPWLAASPPQMTEDTHIHPMITSNGMTKDAICYEEHSINLGFVSQWTLKPTMALPTQIPTANSILPLEAIHTEATCSAAFP